VLTLTEARHMAAEIVVDTLTVHWPEALKDIRVQWNPRLTATAGRATYREGLVELSTQILPAAGPEAVHTVVVHELAHLRAYARYGAAGTGHGRHWCATMRSFGVAPDRCHEFFQLPSVVEATGRPLHACRKCGHVSSMSPARIKRIDRYYHKGCGGDLRVLSARERRDWLDQ